MSYHINKTRIRKDGTWAWRMLRSTYIKGERDWENVPMAELPQYGLHPLLKIEEARELCSRLNFETSKDREADRKKSRALAQYKKQRGLASVHLPAGFAKEFANDYLKAEMEVGVNGANKYKKALSQWEYVKRLIVAIDLPQDQWFQHKRRFYNQFAKNKTSPSYVGKVLRVLNLWGAFMALKTKTSFIPVPPPKGNDREEIADAYLEDTSVRKKTSEPITPKMLESAESKLIASQFRWIYLTVWLGLRPKEVDSLSTNSKITDEDGMTVLWVYQSKLKGIAKEKRFKPIPLIYPQQRRCLKYMKMGLSRPLVKTVQKLLHPQANLYGGRKNFTDLMLSRGQVIEEISTWMGHSRIERTWINYKNRQRVSYRKAGLREVS